MTIVWTSKKRAIWTYGSKKMRSPVTIQINICQTQYIQHINGMGRWLALDLILITRRYTEDDPLDSEDGCVLVCMEKYTATPPPCLSRELVYTVGNYRVWNSYKFWFQLFVFVDPPRPSADPPRTLIDVRVGCKGYCGMSCACANVAGGTANVTDT